MRYGGGRRDHLRKCPPTVFELFPADMNIWPSLKNEAKQNLIAQFTTGVRQVREGTTPGRTAVRAFAQGRHAPLAHIAVCCFPTFGNDVGGDVVSPSSPALSISALSASKTSVMLRMGSPLITFFTSSRSSVSYSTSARANFWTPQRHHEVSNGHKWNIRKSTRKGR